MNITKNRLQIVVTLIFLGFVAWWLSFQHVVENQGLAVQWFGGTYGSLALVGAVIGFLTARKWGGTKSVLGKALTFFSLGLLAQEAGQLILTYYIYGSKIQIPYPSWGDVAYFASTLSYLCGGVFLTKAVGAKFSLKNMRYRVIATAVPIVILLASFLILLYHHQYDWHKPLTVFLDLGYPLGDATYVSLALVAFLLSRKLLGGVMRTGILLLMLALSLQYIADFTFLYQSNRGTYLSGKFDDLFYMIAYYVLTMALVQLHSTYRGLNKRAQGDTPTDGVQENDKVA